MRAKLRFRCNWCRSVAQHPRQRRGLPAGAYIGLKLVLCCVLACALTSITGAAQTTPANQAATNSAKFDGPAELPRVFVHSALADTPAPGKTLLAKSGDNLQTLIDEAACGDTVKLDAGANFVGHFRLPKKPCDDAHWIVIRTSAPDDALPPEGTRINPCY